MLMLLRIDPAIGQPTRAVDKADPWLQPRRPRTVPYQFTSAFVLAVVSPSLNPVFIALLRRSAEMSASTP